MMQAAEEFFADIEETSEHVSGPPLTDGGGDVDGLAAGRGRQRRRVIRAAKIGAGQANGPRGQ
jgi:hypothetical protein